MDNAWKAKWIMDERFYGLSPMNVFHKQVQTVELPEHRPELQNLHTLFRKTFQLPPGAESASLKISADDYYKVYLNGQFIGQGPAPGYYFHYYYNRYDVSEYLTTGTNVIAVHVYYQGLLNRVWNSGDYRQGLIAELWINEEVFLTTDASWKYWTAQEFTGTETTGYNTQYLENLDYRMKQVGWRTVEYDDSDWKSACEHPHDDHTLIFQPTPPLEVYEVRPHLVRQIGEEGHYIIDFGHETTGQFKMQARGEAGQIIEIRCGEEPEEGTDSSVRFQMRCNCTYQEYWTLSGGPDVLEYYDYKAFRYVEILDPHQTAAPESFCAVVRHYPFDDTQCTFESSDPLLNGIWQICKNGVQYGSQEVYVDCPSREKGQYLGDAVITAQSHSYLTGDLRLWKKSLRDFALSTLVCPGMMAVAPGSFMQEIADFSLLWPLHLLKYYWHSGDREFLQEMYPAAEGLLTYFRQYQREDGLLENVKEKWNLVDWPDNYRDGYDFDLPKVVGDGCHNVINAFYCGMVKTMNAIRNILQIEYEDQFPALKQSFINAFYNPQAGLFVDSPISQHSALHSNTIALFYGLVPDEAVPRVVELIRNKRFSCGVYFAYFLLKGLARAGEYAVVYNLLTSEDEHSWTNMIREGATTCFEAWGKDQKWNTSLCHPWASSPIIVLIEDIFGLKPAKPGWEAIQFTPHIPTSLSRVILEIPTVQGKIMICCDAGNVNIQTPAGVRVVEHVCRHGISR